MLTIRFCRDCNVWSALVVCPSCSLESRQADLEGNWSAAVSLNLDPVDDVQGSKLSCCWCGWVGFVDEETRARRCLKHTYTFDVDAEGL